MTQTANNLVKPVIKFLSKDSDLRVCYKSSRAVSTIQKMADGRYQVVKLYDGEVGQFDDYNEAREVACSAAMTQPPRTKKDAA